VHTRTHNLCPHQWGRSSFSQSSHAASFSWSYLCTGCSVHLRVYLLLLIHQLVRFDALSGLYVSSLRIFGLWWLVHRFLAFGGACGRPNLHSCTLVATCARLGHKAPPPCFSMVDDCIFLSAPTWGLYRICTPAMHQLCVRGCSGAGVTENTMFL
jgi:hypothetical protein